MQFSREGKGEPLLLVHGLGSSRLGWKPLLGSLGVQRELILVDLPGHGGTASEADSATYAGLVRSLDALIAREGWAGIDMAGFSMGGRLVLEMARRGRAGAVVALNPGGFWSGWERAYVRTTLGGSVALLRTFPALAGTAQLLPSRTLLFGQQSAHPWDLDPDLVEAELRSFAATPHFDDLLEDLAYGPMQEGAAAASSSPVTIGWGRHDRVCLPIQAERAHAAFPDARLHWFERSGHYSHWDQPEEAADLILASTA